MCVCVCDVMNVDEVIFVCVSVMRSVGEVNYCVVTIVCFMRTVS